MFALWPQPVLSCPKELRIIQIVLPWLKTLDNYFMIDRNNNSSK